MSKAATDDDLGSLARGTGALIACIAQSLNESDPTFEERLLKRVAAAYAVFRDEADQDEALALSLMTYTRHLLTGFDMIKGQGEPFLTGRV